MLLDAIAALRTNAGGKAPSTALAPRRTPSVPAPRGHDSGRCAEIIRRKLVGRGVVASASSEHQELVREEDERGVGFDERLLVDAADALQV